CTYLDPRRLVTTELFLRGPNYRGIWISVGIDVVAGESQALVRERVRAELLRFLAPVDPTLPPWFEDVPVSIDSPYVHEERGWPPPDWDESRGEATLPELLYRFPAGVADRPPLLSDRRGAGRDRFGNWYWIDADRTGISVESAGSGETTEFWSSLHPGRRPGPA